MSKILFNTYKDNPPENVPVMASIVDFVDNELDVVLVYRNEGGTDQDERLYKNHYGQIVGRVEKWRFLTKEELIQYGY